MLNMTGLFEVGVRDQFARAVLISLILDNQILNSQHIAKFLSMRFKGNYRLNISFTLLFK